MPEALSLGWAGLGLGWGSSLGWGWAGARLWGGAGLGPPAGPPLPPHLLMNSVTNDGWRLREAAPCPSRNYQSVLLFLMCCPLWP